jgi:hypothetical protein
MRLYFKRFRDMKKVCHRGSVMALLYAIDRFSIKTSLVGKRLLRKSATLTEMFDGMSKILLVVGDVSRHLYRTFG